MRGKKINCYFLWFFVSFLIIGWQTLRAQALGSDGDLKWLVVNSLQTYFSEHASETETGGVDNTTILFSWPAEYGQRQTSMRARGLFIGCTDFYCPLAIPPRSFPYFVLNSGPKPNEYSNRPIYDAVDFRLFGQQEHPAVTVDDVADASQLDVYDLLDVVDPNLPSDRMLIVRNHSLMGVTITKKVYAFTQKGHDNYYIYDYLFTNTGIIDEDSTVYAQTVNNFYVWYAYRYTLAGESMGGVGAFGTDGNTNWGRNTVNDDVGTDPTAAEFNDPDSLLYHVRANLAWYGPHSARPVGLEGDWGCPNQLKDGTMAAARFIGCATLHADRSSDLDEDDLYQPVTTGYIPADGIELTRSGSVFDTTKLQARYEAMRSGHMSPTHAEEIETSGLAANEWQDPNSQGYGGYAAHHGFGPYTLEPGDSVRIVLCQGVAGLSRAKNREVGGNWLQWYNGTGNPTLVRPNGETTTDFDLYKKEWVLTCRDSLLKMFQNAQANYNSGYTLPKPPPPPDYFTVQSAADRIFLSWADNAKSHANFNGYVIYRSAGHVSDSDARYEQIFECNANNAVYQYDDLTPVRGVDYYYYIQTKDNGSGNNGVPLYSSMFYTLTNEPAQLQRPYGEKIQEVRVVPNPYDLRSSEWAGRSFEGTPDRIAFWGIPPVCRLKIFTERGDLIWEKYHDSYTGDELWDSRTMYGQVIVSGIYILHVQVVGDILYDEDVYDESTGELLHAAGDLMFRKGESVFRKFVVIR